LRYGKTLNWGLERFIVAHNAPYLQAVKRNLTMNADRNINSAKTATIILPLEQLSPNPKAAEQQKTGQF